MRHIALIRCSTIGPAEQALRRRLAPVFGQGIHFVRDDMLADGPVRRLPPGAVSIDPGFIACAGLRLFPRVGWQCGDYAYYAARAALPDFDHAWLIEPDVGFTFRRVADFFDHFADLPDDMLGAHFGPRDSWWGWTRTTEPLVGAGRVHGCAYPITRLSARAIDHLAAARAASFRDLPPSVIGEALPNDEAFTASILMRDGFACRALEAIAPAGTFAGDSFSTAMAVMPEELACPAMADRVVHAVRNGRDGRHKLRHMRLFLPEHWAKARNRVIANLGRAAWCRWTLPSRML